MAFFDSPFWKVMAQSLAPGKKREKCSDDVFSFQDSDPPFLAPILIFREFLFAKPWGQRPYERLEYLKWVWELWQPLRSSLRLEKHLDQTQESMMSWVELLWLWLFFVEKKEAVEACWNIFLLEGITRYHPKQKKDMGQFSDSEFPLGKKVKPLSQTRPFLTRRLWQRWTNSWPGAQSKWCLGCVKIDYPSLKINLDARKNSCVWKEMKCFKLIICLGVYVKFPKEKWSVSGHYHEFFPQLQRPVFALRVSPSRVWLEMRGHQY